MRSCAGELVAHRLLPDERPDLDVLANDLLAARPAAEHQAVPGQTGPTGEFGRRVMELASRIVRVQDEINARSGDAA